WLQRAEALSAVAMVVRFEESLDALWKRAHLTLGEVTLGAIVGRVLYTATEKSPFLAHVRIEEDGIGVGELRTQCAGLDPTLVREAMRFVLLELLVVIGNLTAEILTPALH